MGEEACAIASLWGCYIFFSPVLAARSTQGKLTHSHCYPCRFNNSSSAGEWILMETFSSAEGPVSCAGIDEHLCVWAAAALQSIIAAGS